MADKRLEEIRQSISNVWGKQPCWPNEKDCVLHIVAPYLLRRLEAAEAVVAATIRASAGSFVTFTSAMDDAYAEYEKVVNDAN